MSKETRNLVTDVREATPLLTPHFRAIVDKAATLANEKSKPSLAKAFGGAACAVGRKAKVLTPHLIAGRADLRE